MDFQLWGFWRRLDNQLKRGLKNVVGNWKTFSFFLVNLVQMNLKRKKMEKGKRSPKKRPRNEWDFVTGKLLTTRTEYVRTPHQTKSLDISPPFNPFTLERWDLGTKIITYKTKTCFLRLVCFKIMLTLYCGFIIHLWVWEGITGNPGQGLA